MTLAQFSQEKTKLSLMAVVHMATRKRNTNLDRCHRSLQCTTSNQLLSELATCSSIALPELGPHETTSAGPWTGWAENHTASKWEQWCQRSVWISEKGLMRNRKTLYGTSKSPFHENWEADLQYKKEESKKMNSKKNKEQYTKWFKTTLIPVDNRNELVIR